MTCRILIGDMRERLREIEADSLDSCATDPPYHLTSIVKRFGAENAKPVRAGVYNRSTKGFMGQTWDGGDVAFDPATWAEVYRVLKPGAHLVAFSGSRTYHRMVCAIEDAGFEIRDQLAWVYGSGFPKSHDVSKAIDRMAGAERECTRPGVVVTGGYGDDWAVNSSSDRPRFDAPATPEAEQWQGWGTALKPAWEPIVLARKPLSEKSVAANVLQHGTGAINIDAARIATDELTPRNNNNTATIYEKGFEGTPKTIEPSPLGRWPANIIHDGSEEVLAGFPDSKSTGGQASLGAFRNGDVYGKGKDIREKRDPGLGDEGSAARFFYCAKADASERHIGGKNDHPTVKPVGLMRWLVRLITPKGGTVLDPFAGSGSTLIAADREQFNAIGIELSEEYAAIAQQRLSGDRGGLLDAMEAA